ncbi:MAG: CsgG/HfaB family protein [Synergistaceae bacterium]|nr:CsgG/HfaB family protein [Synergistaceae bacterium]
MGTKFGTWKFGLWKFGLRAVAAALCVGLAFSLSCLSCRAEAAVKKKIPSSSSRTEAPRSAPLPKKGSIAVLVQGPSEQHNASALSIMIQQLTTMGYKIMDQNKLAQIRRSKAAQYALEGNVDAIMKLSSQYGIATTVTVTVTAGQPVENEFQLQTGTATAAVKAISSGGAMLYGDTISGKQVGYTPDEASQKAIEAAIRTAAERMTQ